MSSGWFETVAAAQRRARKQLPKSVYWSIVAGSEQGATLKDNVAAFGELGFTPHAGGLPAKRDLATTLLGQPVSMPVILSPTGVQAVHPDGEVAVARAAANRGTAVGLSSVGSKPVEEVVAANPQTFFRAYAQWPATQPPTWDDVAWLRQLWGGPFLVKGITRVDDAKRAVDAGATAVSVSNHGGNDLDGTPATIRALPAVAAAVGGQAEVLLDGGVRRGGDVVKAVALGAKAVMIGRAYLWGLAANGQAGVENVLDILRAGIDSALLGLGKASTADVTPDDIVVPPGFTRTLGADRPVFGPALNRQRAE